MTVIMIKVLSQHMLDFIKYTQNGIEMIIIASCLYFLFISTHSLHLHRLMTSAQKLGSEFLSVESWQKWCINMIRSLHTIRGHKWSQGVPSTTKNKKGESPAIEVWRKIDADGYFASRCRSINKL